MRLRRASRDVGPAPEVHAEVRPTTACSSLSIATLAVGVDRAYLRNRTPSLRTYSKRNAGSTESLK